MIHVENLTKYYDAFCAVDNISFDIKKGEILGLLGPNGAGKTTTLRMLTGFLAPTSGGIQVKEFTVSENPLEVKKLLGYLPESAPLYHDMLVYDYLDYIAGIRDIPVEKKISRIHEIGDLCGLNEVMHKTVSELSKGYKQRVGLAHAMMSDPEILVLDEATSGLDPNQIIEIRNIIKEIGKKKTIILSTHILSEAEATCDRIIIIHQGKIAADGSAELLKQKAGGGCNIHLSLQNADAQAVTSTISAISGVTSVEPVKKDGESPDSVHFNIACGASDNIRNSIYVAIKQTDWILTDFHKETQSLETIFQELTKEN